MQKFLPGPLPDNARNLLRRLGYGEHTGFGGQTSFSKRLTGGDFPRFHAYVEDKNGGIQINLHLDQKPANLGSGAAHGGEYEGPLVAGEMADLVARIQGMAQGGSQSGTRQTYEDDPPPSKKGFFGSLFG